MNALADDIAVIAEEGHPALALLLAGLPLWEVARHRRQADLEAQLLELALDLAGAPGILCRNSSDEFAYLERDRRPSGAALRDRSPVEPEALTVRSHRGLALDDDEGLYPAWPEAEEGDPERPIQSSEPEPGPLLSMNRQLLAESELDDSSVAARPEQGRNSWEDDEQVAKGGRNHSVILRDLKDLIESDS